MYPGTTSLLIDLSGIFDCVERLRVEALNTELHYDEGHTVHFRPVWHRPTGDPDYFKACDTIVSVVTNSGQILIFHFGSIRHFDIITSAFNWMLSH